MQVLAKSSRMSTEPEPINFGLELTFAVDMSVHLNCIRWGFFFRNYFILLQGLGFLEFGLFWFFLSHFPVAPENKLLIRRKS